MWLVVCVLGPLRFWLILAFVKKMTKTRQQHNYSIYTYTTLITFPYLLHTTLITLSIILFSITLTIIIPYLLHLLHYPLRFALLQIHYYVSITVFPLMYSFICLSVIYRQFIILNLFGVSSLCSELILFDSAVYIAFYLFCLCIKRF